MKHILFIILLATTTLYANESRSPDITYKLFTVMKLDKTFQETLDKMVDVQIVQNPSIAPAKATMMKFFEKHMGWESMKPELAKIYMKHNIIYHLLMNNFTYSKSSILFNASSAPRGTEIVLNPPCDSLGLIRMVGPSIASEVLLTVGMAVPAPISMLTTLELRCLCFQLSKL